MMGWRFYILAGKYWRNGILMSPSNEPGMATYYTPEMARAEARAKATVAITDQRQSERTGA